MEYLVSVWFYGPPIDISKTPILKGVSFQNTVWYFGRVQAFYFAYSLLTSQETNLRLYLGDLLTYKILCEDMQFTFTISAVGPDEYLTVLFESESTEEEVVTSLEKEYHMYLWSNQYIIPTLDTKNGEDEIVTVLKGSKFLLKHSNGHSISNFI